MTQYERIMQDMTVEKMADLLGKANDWCGGKCPAYKMHCHHGNCTVNILSWLNSECEMAKLEKLTKLYTTVNNFSGQLHQH